jgi:hypothetical protein
MARAAIADSVTLVGRAATPANKELAPTRAVTTATTLLNIILKMEEYERARRADGAVDEQ